MTRGEVAPDESEDLPRCQRSCGSFLVVSCGFVCHGLCGMMVAPGNVCLPKLEEVYRDRQRMNERLDALEQEKAQLAEQARRMTRRVLSGEHRKKLIELMRVLEHDVRRVPSGAEDWERLCDAEDEVIELFDLRSELPSE